MKITGIKCNHQGCEARTFLDDEDALDWLTVQMSSPGSGFRAQVHYCPEHGTSLVGVTDLSDEKLNTGQRRLINPDHVDGELAQALGTALDHANERDLARAGLAATEWQANVPVEPVPIDLGVLSPTAAQEAAEPTTQLPIAAADQHKAARQRRPGGNPGVMRTAMLTAVLFCASLLSKGPA